MKILIATLIAALSAGAFATERDATFALTQTLPKGIYTGQTPFGDACEVSVQNSHKGIVVTASSQGESIEREVIKGSVYRWQPAQRFFLSSEIVRTNNRTEEKILRTIAATDSTQYVVLANRTTSGRQNNEHKIECEIDL